MDDYTKLVMINNQQRAAVLANAVEMKQPIYNGAVVPTTQNVVNIAPRNVGLIKGFLIEVIGTLTNGAGAVATLSNNGVSNLLSNITFTDLNNNQRVNVPGWYLALLNSARQGWAFGGSYAPNLAIGYGNNFPVNSGPATIAASTDAAVRMIYYLPLAYSGEDLRGSIYAAVVSATMNLQVTINPTPFVGALPQNSINAVYTGNALGGWKAATPVQINVVQVYLDQLPMVNGGPVVPMLDLNTVYDLKSVAQTGIAAGTDFTVAYSNYREFLSTTAVFNNGNTFNNGSDVNYFALQSANFTQLFKLPPSLLALEARQVFMSDVPLGTYYFNHRNRPVNTQAFGNMELVLNASSAGAGSVLTVGYEAFAQVNQLVSGISTSLGN